MSAAALLAALAAVQQRQIASGQTASSSVTVVAQNRIVYERAMGSRNLSPAESATPETLYRIGSVTKLFTALAAMQLIEQGKLSLDTTLDRFEPAFPNASVITVRELLMHRSGIPNYLDDALVNGSTQHPTTPQAIIASVAKMAPASKPGTAYLYSNTNYVLLGQIVERVSGTPLHAYYRTHIFAPAGMRETFAGSVPASEPAATGYMLSAGTAPQQFGDLSWAYGCGDIISTAGDLARFDIALMNGRLVKPATFAEMISSALPAGDGSAYGLGIEVFRLGSKLLVGHHGGLPGFEADDEMIPADRFAVATLGNDFKYMTGVTLNAALQAYYPSDVAAAATAQRAAVAAQAAKDSALTTRFDAFLKDLLAGRVDGTQLTPAMTNALTPAAVASLRQSFAPLGAFRDLTFVGEDSAGGYERYSYTAQFANGAQRLTFVLDANGKLAGLLEM